MSCITCNAEALDLQNENSLLNVGWYYCTTCKLEFNDNDVKIAELAHWKAVDEVFAGTEPEDFDRITGKLIDYGSHI